MKISQNFDLREFVPREIYNQYGEKSIWFLDPKIITLAEFYRTHFKAPVTINNWSWGGKFNNRGYRSPMSTVGGRMSQHKAGRAFDCNIKGYTTLELVQEIMSNQDIFLAAGLTTIEDPEFTPGWLHSDIRWTGLDHILIVKP